MDSTSLRPGEKTTSPLFKEQRQTEHIFIVQRIETKEDIFTVHRTDTKETEMDYQIHMRLPTKPPSGYAHFSKETIDNCLSTAFILFF